MFIDKVKRDGLYQYLTAVGYSGDVVEQMLEEIKKNPRIKVIRMRRGNPSGIDGIMPVNDDLNDCLYHLNGPLIEFVHII